MSRPLRATLLATAVLAAAVLAGACDDTGGLSPRIEAELLVLETIDGRPLPTTGMPRTILDISAESLSLRADGSGTAVRHWRLVTGEARRDETRLRWTVRNAALEINYVCPNDALVDCIPKPHWRGMLFDDRYVATEAISYATPAVFRRARP